MNGMVKIPPMKNYISNMEEHKKYVGIAIDEKDRIKRMLQRKNEISLLCKYEFTEEMAKQKCMEYGLLSPIYDISDRNGCWFCPNSTDNQLRDIYKNHRDLWDVILKMSKMDNLSNPYLRSFKKVSLSDLNEQFAFEDAQMTIFDFIEPI